MLLGGKDGEMEVETEEYWWLPENVYYNENMPGGNIGKLT